MWLMRVSESAMMTAMMSRLWRRRLTLSICFIGGLLTMRKLDPRLALRICFISSVLTMRKLEPQYGMLGRRKSGCGE